MNTWIKTFFAAVLAAVLWPAAADAQPTLLLKFSSPATNDAPGDAFVGGFSFTPNTGDVSAVITSGTNVVPQSNVSISTPGTNGTITLTPLTNRSGTVSVELFNTLGTQTVSQTFIVVFQPHPPSIAPISNRTIPEDGSTNVPFFVSDADTPLNDLVITATSSNTTLVPNGSLILSGSGADRFILLNPVANINGGSLITLTISDGIYTNTRTFQLTVTPVPDPSTITGIASRAFGDNVGVTNIYAGVGINDVDHNMPSSEQLVATAVLGNDQFVTFSGGAITRAFTGTPAQVTASIAGVGVQPIPYRGSPGTINNVSAQVRVRGVSDNISVTNTINLAVEVINSVPNFATSLSPTSVVEGLPAQPFDLDFIYDPDIGEDQFTLTIQLVNSNQANLVTIAPTNVLVDNIAGLQAGIQNITLQTVAGVLTTLTQQVAFRFTLADGYGGQAVETNVFTIVQAQNPPQITGIPVQTINKTSGDAAFSVYPTAFVQDPNQAGLQPVRAILTQTDSTLGTFSATNLPFMTPAQLSTAIQAVVYAPTPGARPVGDISESTLTLTAIDITGLTATNTSVKVRITSVNAAPQILNVPDLADQPLLIPPSTQLMPFASIGLSNDETNAVVFTLTIDNVNKGSFTNLGAFTLSGPGQYQMSGSVTSILSSLTNIVYVLDPLFPFPPDDPGGTTFTLSARDYALLTTTKTLSIQVQEEPRHHLVVRAVNDGLPGSFTYALANAGNNDVISFALPSYPAVVRMPGATANTLIRNITIKGPGANLLTISGDNNGDFTPDRQLFRIRSRVTMEGVTLSDGVAAFGGAMLVESNGTLTLVRCAVVDSVAAQYGGAIDVDGGQLILDGCFIGRNRVLDDTGVSGGGISIYSDKNSHFINTTFAGNSQPNATGDGGGAVVVQNRTPATPVNAWFTHCTFIENEDAAEAASAVFSVDFNTRVRPWNTIFSDFSGRNIDVGGAGEVISNGGNICDDSSRTANIQAGQPTNTILLNHVTDATETDPVLSPLNADGDPTPYAEPLAGSPAIGKATASTNAVDQRGVLRQGVPESGAVEFNALGRLVINEVLFDDGALNFIELYVRRDSTPIDLAPYSLFIDGVKVHDFASGAIIGTNALYAAGAPAPTLVNPGFGYVVAFTNAPVSVTSDSNPTPVAQPSVTNASMNLDSRGIVTLGAGGSTEPVARQSYLGVYLDPATGTNLLNIAGNSVALAPQYLGFALVPHSLILPGPFDGIDTARPMNVNQFSIGADVLGTPFGQDNAEPLAVPDIFTVSEDDIATLPVRSNDFDGDGNDRLVLVDLSTESDAGVGDVALTNSQQGAVIAIDPDAVPLRGDQILFDPRAAPALQTLPVGVESIDTFYYEIIDIGSAAVEGYTDGTGGTTVVAVTNHRLTNDAEIVISGAAPNDYNGTFAVTVVDENSFTITLPFPGAAVSNGLWETVLPRAPSARSEASVSVRVVGVNDAPVATPDVITNVTERSTVRLMVRPEQAGTPLSFPGDPIPAPVMLTQDVLSNDDDIDSDDSWTSLRAVGVLASVNPISGYTGTPGETPVTVTAPAHGLITGDEILIANYGGHPSYNGYHTITVLDADTFTINQFFVDDAAEKGVWVILNDANRYDAVTDVGATVSLTLRANPEEDHFIYDASVSDFLQGLAEGELYTNRFYYAVEDSHGAIGIGPVDVIVVGVNNTPVANPDAASLSQLTPLVSVSNTLAQVLASGLDLMYTRPPASGTPGRTDLQVLDLSGSLPGTIVLANFFSTDEDTPLAFAATNLLSNDTDIDVIDMLSVMSVAGPSRLGASVLLGSGTITYNPTVSTNLRALTRGELVIDSFNAVISDGMTGGTVTSLVAVLVTGVNDKPTAVADFRTTHEDEIQGFDPRTNDVEHDVNGVIPDDRLRLIAATNVANPGFAAVSLTSTNARHDATVSSLLNQLADWQSFTNVFGYTITDNSFLFATDDEFYVPAGTSGKVLDVLANDRNFTDATGGVTIVSAGPALNGGTVTISTNGQSLVYDSPLAFVGDDYFRYTIQNSAGDQRSGRVMVRSVMASINGVLHAANDHYTVAAGETAVMNVLTNDNMLPLDGSGLTITAIVSSSMPGQPILTNNTFVFVATNGLSPLTFRYAVSGGGASTAEADVTLNVVERRGILNIQDESFSVLPGSLENELDVLANDGLVTESIAALRIQEIVVPTANGTVTTNAAGTRLLYTPDVGFIGIDEVTYVVTDQIGGTGTGVASIAVGAVEAVADFYKLAATTNPVPVALRVLANDRVMPHPEGTLTILSVNPATPTTNGTLAVHGSGQYLLFTPSNTTGQLDVDYVVQDGGSPARVATGRVTIATVASGIYANPDRYVVRGGGSGYVLNVLTNDISYPNVNKTYTILSIGVGANAPDNGGVVAIENNTLVYTPADGFFGEESFTYLMSDSSATDVARVTVSVRRGDLNANDDAYAVYYELLPGTNIAASFTLPVTLNDRILPALDQVLEISALGAGTNVPNQGGSVLISPDKQSLIYRPVLATATSYVEQFTYEISDGGDRRASGVVRVRVLNRASNLVAVTQHDAYTVARGSTNNVLRVLANDFVLPGTAAGWSITAVSPTLYGGTVSISNAVVRYSPPAGFVGVDTFSYSVSDGLGGTGNATVTIRVGGLPTLPDLFIVRSGSTTNNLDVLANDVLTTDYAGEYVLQSVFGQTAGGTIATSAANTVLYTPSPSYVGAYPYTETFFYRVADDAAVLFTGEVRVIVHQASNHLSSSTVTLVVEGRNDQPSITNVTGPLFITDKEDVKPFLQVLITEVDEQTLERVDVTVAIDNSAKGAFRNTDGFVQVVPGTYVLTNVTALTGTARVRDLIFEPVENRITVPQSETTFFTITVTDNKSAPVVNTNSTVVVASVNDAPVITGTRAGQTVYLLLPIHLFSAVSITEVDDLTLQPLTVTVTLAPITNGVLTNVSSFALVTGGVYRATNLTAAAATAQLRLMQFVPSTNAIPENSARTTAFQIAVNDGFALPVLDDITTVIAYNAVEGQVRPTNAILRAGFGQAVDTINDYAVVGAFAANTNGTSAGTAFVYARVPGPSTTNSWIQWRQLQPAQVDTNDRFGRSVAISDSLIAVGADGDEGLTTNSGAVYLFARHLGGSNNWGELLRIVPTNITNAIQFGYSVDLDGDTLVVGAPKANLTIGNQGAVFLFGRNQGGPEAWGEIARRTPTSYGLTNADFGWTVSLSGSNLLVGAPRADINADLASSEGSAFRLARDAGGPNNWGVAQRFDAAQTNEGNDFGWDVAVDADIALIGAPGMSTGGVGNAGVTFVYTWSGASTAFVETVRLSRPSETEKRMGQSLDVKNDMLFIGAPNTGVLQNSGAAYLYRRNPLAPTNWSLLQTFTRSVGSTAASYGSAVGIHFNTAIVGAPGDTLEGTNRGYAFLYRIKQNNAPVLAAPIPTQFADVGVPYGFPIPAGTFTDPDVGDSLVLSAGFPSGSNGLAFVSAIVTGTPANIGLTPVDLQATDESGDAALHTFTVVVLDGVSLSGTPRDLWNLDEFGNAVTNPAQEASLWGGGANPDGDELDNDAEYVFGGDPNTPDDRRITLGPSTDGNLVITYFRRNDDPGLFYTLQGSATMADWFDVAWTVISETTTPVNPDVDFVTLKIAPAPSTAVQHYRILVLQ